MTCRKSIPPRPSTRIEAGGDQGNRIYPAQRGNGRKNRCRLAVSGANPNIKSLALRDGPCWGSLRSPQPTHGAGQMRFPCGGDAARNHTRKSGVAGRQKCLARSMALGCALLTPMLTANYAPSRMMKGQSSVRPIPTQTLPLKGRASTLLPLQEPTPGSNGGDGRDGDEVLRRSFTPI